MRIFVLEDDPMRIVALNRFFDSASTRRWPTSTDPPLKVEVHWASTCFQEDRFKGPYDLILLDHDLGGRQMIEHEDNGREFLRLIKDRVGEALLIIHSWNGGAASLMKQDFPPAVIAQFGSPRFWSLLSAVCR